ncbi:hypothetical protein SAMN04488028_103203 [Reichenbachiella agariperforans]|uniref:Uncharacterized protein n=1 Tax=Reichenbachiella agariperforans TaxID=156994 RepID=A0A1M6Q7W9_REIAG|nr:hypothetical protein SAMN04488028_103203 [Reichenbachiella agariperforans]
MDKEKEFQVCSSLDSIGINMITFSQYGLIIILSFFLVLHVCILTKMIPYKNVWGGRLNSDKEMYQFEIVSILINLFFLFIILVQSEFLSIHFPKSMMTILLWIMTVLFLFNTYGNIISKSKIELWVFTPITIILAVFSLILALTI